MDSAALLGVSQKQLINEIGAGLWLLRACLLAGWFAGWLSAAQSRPLEVEFLPGVFRVRPLCSQEGVTRQQHHHHPL